MTKTSKNKQKILTVLLVALAVSVVYRITHPFKQKQVDTLTFVGKKYIKKITGNKVSHYRGNPTNIMLTLIENSPQHSGRVVKNIFSTKTSAQEGRDKAEFGIKQPANAPSDMQNNMKNSGTSSTKQAGFAFSGLKVFGMYETDKDKVIFMERGKDILALREGDTIDGKFKVQKISNKKVTIKSKDSDKPFFIDMNELENN